jgi:hypothetical protein
MPYFDESVAQQILIAPEAEHPQRGQLSERCRLRCGQELGFWEAVNIDLVGG